MGRMLDALRRIEDQAAREEAEPAAPPVKPAAQASALPAPVAQEGAAPEWVVPESAAPVPRASEPVAPEPAAAASPAPPAATEDRSSGPPEERPVAAERAEARLRESLRQQRFDPRYYELAEAILPQVIGDRRAALLFTGSAGDDSQGGRLVDLYSVLAEQTLGETIVVDCDARRPSVAQRLSVQASLGLSDVLAGRATWRAAAYQTDRAGLSVLPGTVEESSRAVRTLDLMALVDELRRAFQLVLLDGTLATDLDIATLAGICDGTYFVAALGHTPQRSAEQTLRAIGQRGGRVLGCVLLES